MGPIRLPVESEDFGMAKKSVDRRCRNDVVGDDLAPPSEAQVRGDEQVALLVARGHQLEEQMRYISIKGQRPEFVDDEHPLPAQRLSSFSNLPWRWRASVRRIIDSAAVSNSTE